MTKAGEGLGMPGKHKGETGEAHSGSEVRREDSPLRHDEKQNIPRRKTYSTEEWGRMQPAADNERGIVVYEDSRSGEVYLDAQKHVSADFNSMGKYDRVTIFESLEDAEAYVASGKSKP